MPALAPALPPATQLGSSLEPAQIDVRSVSTFGRSLAEYASFFELDLVTLRGRDVLDVAAGPSSFVAEACARRIDAVAVDPLYGEAAEALRQRVELNRHPSAERFLADYAAFFADGRYVRGALPNLPFFDGTFDLVLCGHLLFAAARHYDHAWHLAACRDLVRVSAGEVRIHSIVRKDRSACPGLGRLRRDLRETGIRSEIVANSTLVLQRSTQPLTVRKD